jgi:hypothetical protein
MLIKVRPDSRREPQEGGQQGGRSKVVLGEEQGSHTRPPGHAMPRV